MNFKVNINKIYKNSKLKAFATLIIEDKIYLTGFKIIEKNKKLYVFYPRKRNKDVYFISDKNLRDKIYKTIIFEYQIQNTLYELDRY